MSWFAAHIVQYFKKHDQPQNRVLVWENVVLVEASSREEAWQKAEEYGRADEIDDPSLRVDGTPAALVFAGVRSLVECIDADRRPGDGTEVTYLELELNSEEAVAQFVDNQPVPVRFVDRFREDDDSSS